MKKGKPSAGEDGILAKITDPGLLRDPHLLEDLERLKNFCPMDDTFMREMFRNDKKLVEYVLQTVTGHNGLLVTAFETQADMKRATGSRSVILDVYAVDADGEKLNLEVQKPGMGADVKRVRYYSSVLDIENLLPEQDFKELPTTYVIFITENDWFKRGDPTYVFQMKDQRNVPICDDRYEIIVNGEYRGDDPLGRLMHDFQCSDPNEMYIKLMADRVRALKESSEGVTAMCKIMQDVRNEGLEEGREEGRKEALIEVARSMLSSSELPPEKIAEYTNLSLSEVTKISKRTTV